MQKLNLEDVQKLISHFKTSGETSTKFISSQLTEINTMLDDGIKPELSVVQSYLETGKAQKNKI